ncbi:DUF4270 family protein [Sphingobacterium composti Ten et al. 2007 non Yoo et al. 2007]|uniref:DUF4270 family protein n=1 Tax=Sphingobacterium composti TaxID=363260 RepID=UPI001359860F|nr:DUF4270 family protein [Sphingobacterium composti Ten et al. 2007 non Yoo et al. 2007]
MSQLLRFKYLYFLSIISALSLFASCNKEMSVSLDEIDEDIAVTFIDSFTVHTSTYQLNYLPSSATGNILVGKVRSNDLGSIKSTSYLRLALDSYTDNIPEGAVFDSVNVVLRPNNVRYYYGDTTQIQTLSVHKVTQEIVTTNILSSIDSYNAPVYVNGPTIFSDKKFAYESSALGTGQFRPYVNSIDTISLRLTDEFGKDLFDKINTNDFNVSNIEAFQSYLKGIAIVPEDNNTVVLGFNDTLNIHLNYSYVGSDGFKVTGKKVISNYSPSYQYNNVEYDRTGTPFEGLSGSNREISFQQANRSAVIQSGTGLATKIKIPTLKEFMYNENISINKAELIIETEALGSGNYPAPSSLMLIVSDKNGLATNYVPSPFANTIQQATYMPGNDVGQNGKYIFNLIDYIKNINTNRYIDTDLLISTITPALFGTVNTAKIATENGKPKIKLNIVYTKFR